MRLYTEARVQSFLRCLPLPNASLLVELLAWALLAWLGARLFWAIMTPFGPIGQWHKAASEAHPTSARILSTFDPFFRTTGIQTDQVTTIDLTLFGVRQDRASGRGSAIIGLPDGRQASFMVGETVMPGVTLDAVDFDNITLARMGGREILFLDQSIPAERADTPGPRPESTLPEPAPATNAAGILK